MEQKTNENTVVMDVKVLRDMKAGEEQMALTIQSLADQLDETQDELKTTKESLRVVTKDLRDTRLLLQSAVELQEKAEDTAGGRHRHGVRGCAEAIPYALADWKESGMCEDDAAILSPLAARYDDECSADLSDIWTEGVPGA